MRSNRLSCLSGAGLLAAMITALVIAGYAYASGGLMYSPGPLNAQTGETLGGVTSHAQTGGDCKACHAAPWEAGTMAERCADCHGSIANQMQDVASLHGKVMHNNPALSCRHCHPEHRGAEAPLTALEGAEFPHEAVGFSLNRHQFTAAREAFTCDDCHHGDISVFASNTCQTCHRQMDLGFITAHSLSFGLACLDCHDGVDRLVTGFDHNQYSFKITGKHTGLECVQCHVNARGLGDFQVTLQDCYSCHDRDDAHDGRFGVDCAACHTTDGWTPATFDHNLSAFKLEGKHAQAQCEQCHVDNLYKGTPMDCFSCHTEDDEHSGEFGTDCAACHSTNGWTPAEFTGKHTFPLDHGDGASCATCHPSSFVVYTCYGCHEHNEAEVNSKHLDEGIGDFQNCMECHPNGQKNDEGGEGGGHD